MRRDILSDKRIQRIVFVIIVCLQLLFITYWAKQKCNLFLDEAYSLEYTSDYLDTEKYKVKFVYTEIFQSDTWFPVQPLQDELSLEPEESIFRLSPGEMIRLLFSRRIYFGLLNMAESILSPGEISMYPAILLNCLFFVLIQFVLFRIFKTLRINDFYTLWGVAFYGFCGLIISHVIFVRFYVFTILMFLTVILLHLKMWEEENIWKFFFEEITSLILLYLALKCSELTMIYGGAFVGLYFILLMIKKRWRQALIYGAPMIGISVWYLYTKTILLDILFHPARYTGVRSFAQSYTTWNVTHATYDFITLWLMNYYRWAGSSLFGSTRIFKGLLIILSGIYIVKRIKNKVFVSDPQAVFVLVLCIVFAVYCLFAALAGLFFPKYLCVMLTVLFIIFLYSADRILKDIPYQKVIITLELILLATAVYETFSHRLVDYTYSEHAETINAVHTYKDLDILFIDCNKKEHHAIYDCIYNAGEKVQVYFDISSADLNEVEMPDEMLVWSHSFTEPDFSVRLADFEVTTLGNTRDSVIYHAKRRYTDE